MFKFDKYSHVRKQIKRTLDKADEFIPQGCDTEAMIGIRAYIREFRSFEFKYPRQCGKSNAIAHLYEPGDLLVVRQEADLERRLFDDIKTKMVHTDDEFPRLGTFRKVWIDEVSDQNRVKFVDRLLNEEKITSNSIIVSIGT